jgi:hypothetical protein
MKNSFLILVSILFFASCGQGSAGEMENKIKVGSVGFHIAFKVPNDSIQKMEVFLKTHQKFMRETHHVKGEVEPVVLTYAVLKAPELNNPLDPNSGETGHTLYGITEIYKGPEGAMAHMELGQQREQMFSELVVLTNEYCISGILGAPVIGAMFD